MGLKKRIETGPGGPYFFPLPRSLASFIVSAGIGCTNLTKINGTIQQPTEGGGRIFRARNLFKILIIRVFYLGADSSSFNA